MKQTFHFCGHWQIKCGAISRIRSKLCRCQESGTLISAVERHRTKSIFWKAAADHNLSSVTLRPNNVLLFTVTDICICHKNKWVLYSSVHAFQGEEWNLMTLETHFYIICISISNFQTMKNSVARVIHTKNKVYAYTTRMSSVCWFSHRQNKAINHTHFPVWSHQKATPLLIWDAL